MYESSFTLIKEKQSDGAEKITVRYPAGLSPVSIVWKDEKGQQVGTGNQVTLAAGNYCAEITYHECCNLKKCFNISGCKGIIQDVNINGNPAAMCVGEGPWTAELTLKEGEKASSILWVPSGANGQLNPGSLSAGQYQVKVTTLNGCTDSAAFIS